MRIQIDTPNGNLYKRDIEGIIKAANTFLLRAHVSFLGGYDGLHYRSRNFKANGAKAGKVALYFMIEAA